MTTGNPFRPWPLVVAVVAVGAGWTGHPGAAVPDARRRSPTQEPSVAIRAERVVDVERGSILRDVVVLISGERIAEVRAAAEGAVPTGLRVIDLPGLTLLPGLIDAHVHLTLGGADSSMERTLHAGFTTVLDLGALNGGNLALRRAVAEGERPGPRIVSAGPWLGASGGTCDFRGIGVRGAEAFRRRVREDVDRGADLIKVCVTGWPRDAVQHPDSVEITVEELDAAIGEARRLGRKVVAHAIGRAGVRLAVERGVDAIAHAGFPDSATAGLMATRRVFLIPTLWSLAGAPDDSIGALLLGHTRRVVQAGVPIAFGTDAGVIPHGRNGHEFVWLVRAGMSPAAAIRAATADAAAMLGWGERIGAIAPGRYADLIAVEGNPLEDIEALERVAFVMKEGRAWRHDR